MHKCYIGLGSNVGNREENISRAIELVGKSEKIIKVSTLIETEPMYHVHQNKFINGAMIIETEKSPLDLLHFLKDIEKKLQREKSFRNGPRIIDLDLLFYDDLILNSEELILPRPLISERFFDLKPLCEIDPEYKHPLHNKTIKQLLFELESTS